MHEPWFFCHLNEIKYSQWVVLGIGIGDKRHRQGIFDLTNIAVIFLSETTN